MACHIAENRPLSLLRDHLGLRPQCHSFRTSCAMQRRTLNAEGALGAPGAVLGYCQALFSYAGTARAHTTEVLRTLQSMNAPWWASHELYLDHRSQESASDFIVAGMEPLIGFGRVPVLITGLDPAVDGVALRDLLATRPPVTEGETVLVRVVLRSEESFVQAARWLRALRVQAFQTGRMPRWWPLLQSELPAACWHKLREELQSTWQYVNIAVNPFVGAEAFRACADQVTVAQVVIGLADGVAQSGRIELPPRMAILGMKDERGWDLDGYAELLRRIDYAPTVILLGPAQRGWTMQMNVERIAASLPHVRTLCSEVWKEVSSARRDYVLQLSA